MGKLLNVTYLELNSNQLDGEVPQDLMKCRTLSLLNLAKNNLQDGLPRGFDSLEKLVIMNLQYNKLNGEIPFDLSNLANLITLDLSHNAFAGCIPPTVSNLAKLQILNLEDNELVGLIANSLYALPSQPQPGSIFLTLLKSLTELVLSGNLQLSGELPALNPKTVIAISGTGINKSASTQGEHWKRKSNIVILIVVIVCMLAGFAIIAMLFGLVILKKFDQTGGEALQPEESSLSQIVKGHFITSDSIHNADLEMARA
ncbi:putative leucine-rich repeat receptor-like protein kinase [Apostasia shenzhenica]|uniref:Putative leucine-rich repeat receptor-like protein kinase n=1 Tax=Apostasia shenzhenica TaxID=1088818 RepID=A0A2I0AG51_9ASPA|nr:putative leucine-rich repeat receptor-like protein kinase [Apostasia shenzhenica]